ARPPRRVLREAPRENRLETEVREDLEDRQVRDDEAVATVFLGPEDPREDDDEEQRGDPLDAERRDAGEAAARERAARPVPDRRAELHASSPRSERGSGRPARASRMPRTLGTTPACSP